MKKMSKNILFIVIGVLLAFTIDVAAEAVISSGAVSYSNTTVSAALDELFSAVDINNKIGTTDISSIGDGTITGAVSAVNNGKLDGRYAVVTIDLTTGEGWSSFPDGFDPWNCIIIGHRDVNKYGVAFGNMSDVEVFINGDGKTVYAKSSGNYSGTYNSTHAYTTVFLYKPIV